MRRKRKPRRRQKRLPELTVAQILVWADDLHDRTGRWPGQHSGRIPGSLGENWHAINVALARGYRGLPGGSSLAQLLAERRGKRNHLALPHLTEEQILAWADDFQRRTGQWPVPSDAGPVVAGSAETWSIVETALRDGIRGLPGGSSLARLLAERRQVRNSADLPRLRVPRILAWADAHHRRTGQWPDRSSGPIAGAPGETWMAMDKALNGGRRGLPGGSSLARLLAERRGLRHPGDLPPLTIEQIVAWADAFHLRTGKWPSRDSGPVPGTSGETWTTVVHAFERGRRGLPRGLTLHRVLAAQGRDLRVRHKPPLRLEQILAWADDHFRETGRWPTSVSGAIRAAPGETWVAVNAALHRGDRGLPRGSSLARLLAECRGKRNHLDLPALTPARILTWADAHHRRTRRWPTVLEGPVMDAPGETWSAIDAALREGCRGLPRGSSLFRLLHANGRGQADGP